VAIYGGFAGFGEPDPNARDINAYETILYGNIGLRVHTDNSYHVVTGSGTDVTAVLDGFTITAGNANGSYPDNVGGRMCNMRGSSPTLTNCTFRGNSVVWDGGGMFNLSSSPTLTNCTFSGNSAKYSGGGMLNDESSPTVTNCTFSGNSAEWDGGGMSSRDDSPSTLTNCILWGNTARTGAQIYNDGTSLPAVSYSDVQGG
jgi:hypothetical protein